MFEKVIVGDDGLGGGRDAIALAKAVAPKADILLTAAYPYDSVPTGLVREELDKLAAEVDLLVSGSRSWGPIRRTVLGSISDRLIHHAPCPVLVVPRTSQVTDPTTPAETAAQA
jgi:hypothetical protein